MTRRVIILSGVSGSGKTTLAKRYWPATQSISPPGFPIPTVPTDYDPGLVIHVSADDYFYSRANGAGEYKFDPSKLEHAHGACLTAFIEACQRSRTSTIVVDNTNTTVAEIAPYYAVARAYGFDVFIVDVGPSLLAQDAYERCTHGVSLTAIEQQIERIEHCITPAFWRIQHIQDSELSHYHPFVTEQ